VIVLLKERENLVFKENENQIEMIEIKIFELIKEDEEIIKINIIKKKNQH